LEKNPGFTKPISSSQSTVKLKLSTFGTWGLNSTARCTASTAFNSCVLRPRLDAASGKNLHQQPLSIIIIPQENNTRSTALLGNKPS